MIGQESILTEVQKPSPPEIHQRKDTQYLQKTKAHLSDLWRWRKLEESNKTPNTSLERANKLSQHWNTEKWWPAE